LISSTLHGSFNLNFTTVGNTIDTLTFTGNGTMGSVANQNFAGFTVETMVLAPFLALCEIRIIKIKSFKN
jgi:hypothetical protein